MKAKVHTSHQRHTRVQAKELTAGTRRDQSANRAGQSRADLAHIKVLDFGEDVDKRKFVRIEIKTSGERQQVCVALEEIATPNSKGFDRLNRAGAHLVSYQARTKLIQQIQAMGPQPSRFTVATALGWHDGHFVLPNRIIPPSSKLVLQLDDERPERYDRYRLGGSRKGWDDLAKLMRGNSRLILASCLTLHGVVGSLIGAQPDAILVVGGAEMGKSTLLVFAGSVWGCHTSPVMADKLGFALPWFGTEFDIEKEGLAANCTVVLLDESREQSAEPFELIRMMAQQTFRLEGGFEKGRGTAGHRRRAVYVSWMATSNVSLEAAPQSFQADDALRGRLTEIPAPINGHGMFEDLHGFQSLGKFCVHMKKASRTHFGHAAPAFIERVAEWAATDLPGLTSWVEERQRRFEVSVRNHVQLPDRAMDRIVHKFATLYAVGCLAGKFKLVPLSRDEVRDGLQCCLRDHITHVERMQAQASSTSSAGRIRPTALGQPPLPPLEQLCAHIRESPPMDLRSELVDDNADYDVVGGPGLLLGSRKHGVEFCISNEKLEAIVGGRSRAQQLKHRLEETGDIATAQGVGDARFSVKRTITKPTAQQRHRPNLIAIKASALGLGGGGHSA